MTMPILSLLFGITQSCRIALDQSSITVSYFTRDIQAGKLSLEGRSQEQQGLSAGGPTHLQAFIE